MAEGTGPHDAVYRVLRYFHQTVCFDDTSFWPEIDVDAILAKVKEIYKNEEINDIDGVKIDFADKWVHLRKSNTEPIIRVYSEASTMEAAEEIGQKIMDVINELAK